MNITLIPPQRRTLQHGSTTVVHLGSIMSDSNFILAQVAGEFIAFLEQSSSRINNKHSVCIHCIDFYVTTTDYKFAINSIRPHFKILCNIPQGNLPGKCKTRWGEREQAIHCDNELLDS